MLDQHVVQTPATKTRISRSLAAVFQVALFPGLKCSSVNLSASFSFAPPNIEAARFYAIVVSVTRTALLMDPQPNGARVAAGRVAPVRRGRLGSVDGCHVRSFRVPPRTLCSHKWLRACLTTSTRCSTLRTQSFLLLFLRPLHSVCSTRVLQCLGEHFLGKPESGGSSQRACAAVIQRHVPVVWPQAQRDVVQLNSGGVIASELRRERQGNKRGG